MLATALREHSGKMPPNHSLNRILNSTPMIPTLHFKYVQIDGKKLTISLFRQLHVVDLCDQKTGKKKEELSPLGVIRYKHEHVALWTLAMRGEEVVRCPLSPTLQSKELEERLASWVHHIKIYDIQSNGKDSFAHQQADKYRMAIVSEPERFAAHIEATNLEQIFL